MVISKNNRILISFKFRILLFFEQSVQFPVPKMRIHIFRRGGWGILLRGIRGRALGFLPALFLAGRKEAGEAEALFLVFSELTW
jgi:hypothetical protein